MAGISKKRVKTKNGEITKYTITYYDVFGKQHTSGIYDTIKEAKRHLWNLFLLLQRRCPAFGCWDTDF